MTRTSTPNLHLVLLRKEIADMSDEALFEGIAAIDKIANPAEHMRLLNAALTDELRARYPEAASAVDAAWEDKEGRWLHLSFLELFHASVRVLAELELRDPAHQTKEN